MHLRSWLFAAVACLAASCDTVTDPAVAAWVGRYDAAFRGRMTYEAAGRMRTIDTVEVATMAIRDVGGARILVEWELEKRGARGALTFAVAGNDATYVPGSPLNEPIAGRFSNGVLATWICESCTAHVDGDTLSQQHSGEAGGTDDGVAWRGRYEGVWTARRVDDE